MDIGTFTIASLCILMLLLFAQLHPALTIVSTLRHWKRDLVGDNECPHVAVVLVLRGSDPFLDSCVEQLLTLDYPSYDVRIVVDHHDDPAWQVVHDVIERLPTAIVQVEPLYQPLETCTLNCSSIIQAVTGLDDKHEIVAFCDADTRPHKSWLRELVTPLVKDEADIVTGQRWYMPLTASLGALVRYIWNVGGVISAAEHSVWGGSFALTRDCLTRSGLIDRWRLCMGSDAMIYPQIQKLGFRLRFIPSVMMINRETCSIRGFFGWVQRQLLVARLYLKIWPLVVMHGILTTLMIASIAALLVVAAVHGHWTDTVWLGAALWVYALVNVGVLLTMEFHVRRICASRGELSRWLTPVGVVKMFVALPATQFVYVAALLKAAMFMRRFEWRGAEYEVKGPWQIRLLEYQPYQPPSLIRDQLASTD